MFIDGMDEAAETFLKTNLHITNVGAESVTLTVSLLPRLVTGTPAAPRVYTLAAGQTVVGSMCIVRIEIR